MKKKYIVIFSLVFLLIPTYIVVSFLVTGSETPINLRSLRSVEILTPNGGEYTFDANAEDGIADLFLNMIVEKKSVSVLDKKVDPTRSYKVNFITDLFNTEYDFIFTSDPSSCFIKHSQGVKNSYYRIPSALAERFLATEYSEGVYTWSSIPTLKIGDTQVNASKIDWSYKTAADTFKKSKEYIISDEIVTIGAVATDFNCSFSVKPDNIDVKISRIDNGETIYIGKHSGISSITTSDNHMVRIEIYANWSEGLSKDYYGSITYVEHAKLHAPAYFYLSEPQVKEGEFVVISVKNVINISKLQFSCEDLEFTPVFFKDGDYYRAYVPIPIGTLSDLKTNDSKITFKLKSDDSEASLDLLILERVDSSKTVYNIKQTVFDEMSITSNPYTQLYSKIKEVIGANTDFTTNYVVGRFFEGYSGTAKRSAFGTHIKYSSVSGVFRGYDSHYVGSAKDEITAVNSGKVVFVGNFDYTGGLVVVDHGYGLLSWYWNIGKYAEGISVGDILTKGDVIGYNGGGGLSETIGGKKASVHIGITIFDEPIDIAPLVKQGVIIENK